MRPGAQRRNRCVALVAALSLLAGACGSDDPGVADPTDTRVLGDITTTVSPAPATEAPPADEAPSPESSPPPERIVSLSPTHTEMLFAIGAGDQVVAVEEFSDYPPEARELPNDLSGFEPNVEAIAGFEPDLVVIGGDFTGLGDQLAQLGIASWDGPAAMTLDDTYRQIEQLGSVTGHVDEAQELVASMRSRIMDIVEAAPVPAEPLDYYHELDSTLFSADSTTFIGEVYSLLGLRNIADGAEGESFGFPQLNAEFIVSADPDLIFLADTKCCEVTAASVAGRPGWDVIAAVENGNVIEMDDDLASRWGPRIVDYLEEVAAAVAAATVRDSG